jgi:hypothetical protein
MTKRTSNSKAALLLTLLCTWAGPYLWAHGNERGTAKATIGNAEVTISYAGPALKGRDPLSMIQPGQLWRLGADIPTTLETTGDLDFGGTRVTKGKYILLARMNAPGKWSLIVSTKPVQRFDDSAKVAEIPMEFEQGKDSVEEMKITLNGQGDGGVMEVAWGTARLRASFMAAK